jgi:hypothetical protein
MMHDAGEKPKFWGEKRMVSLPDLGGAIPIVSIVISGTVALLGVVGYQSRRAKLAAIRLAFRDAVEMLAAPDMERRLAAAILLRRFLDPRSEHGMRDYRSRRRAPYASDAQNVMAAVLRSIPRGDLQKLLADGLGYAPTLKSADLQRTNLQDAFLGSRQKKAWWNFKATRCSLVHADFYQADLSAASLKGADARQAAFYQARLRNTVLRDANLQEANFFEADLSGANFRGSLLAGASFVSARNIPSELAPFIDAEGLYFSSKPAPSPAAAKPKSRQVFLSAPSNRTPTQDSICERLAEMLNRDGLVLDSLPPHDYPPSGALAEVARRIGGCAGVVVLGLSRGGPESDTLSAGTTPWTHVEAGLAYGRDVPLLLLREPAVSTGAFDDVVSGHRAHVVELGDCWNEEALRDAMAPWIFEVMD